MSINWKKSAELNNCTVDELEIWFERFPKSNKRVIAICEGEDCENNNKEREISFGSYKDLCGSCANKKRFKDPKEHEKTSETMKKYFEIPEARKKASDGQQKRWENPEEHIKTSVAVMKARIDDPMIIERISKGVKKAHRNDSTISERKSVSLKIAHKEHPESWDGLCDMMRGGEDIVKHHYIYDHNDLSLYTTEMTRSQHNTIHKCLRASGNEIPHINVK